MKGIDVSSNQGYIDWKKVKADGVEFAILRATTKNQNPDTQLASNIKGCIENGIPADFYKYSYATTNEAAKKEALRVVEVLKSLGVMPSKDVVIWMDVEDSCQFALSTKALTTIVDLWKEIIVNSGYGFGLYMGKHYYEKGEIDVSQFNDDYWIARYYKGDTQMKFAENPNSLYRPVAKNGKLWGWQYTSKGVVSGIKGNVDLDEAYYDIKKLNVNTEYYDTPEFTLIDSLNKIGVYSSYANRKQIALANGIANYEGTAEQNLKILDLLNNGKLIKA